MPAMRLTQAQTPPFLPSTSTDEMNRILRLCHKLFSRFSLCRLLHMRPIAGIIRISCSSVRERARVHHNCKQHERKKKERGTSGGESGERKDWITVLSVGEGCDMSRTTHAAMTFVTTLPYRGYMYLLFMLLEKRTARLCLLASCSRFGYVLPTTQWG